METDKVKNIVEGTFTKTDLSVVVQHKNWNWNDQFQAALNLIPEVGEFLTQEYQNYKDYRDSKFFRKYTLYRKYLIFL